MSESLAKWAKSKQPKKHDDNDEEHMPPAEKRALDKLREEAKKAGATLGQDGKGGLPSSLVLHVLRRDKYRCKRCGSKKDIGPHHKGGIVESKWLSKKGHHNDPNNLSILCAKCHDKVHNEARKEGVDSSQVKPSGDDYKGQHGHD